ncbi:MAG: branched-chain amino acid ABC transporter substrate-binding protein [Polaromonas sp.]|nr:branched-chain amino acid ABC transporter substrate-binding protein [Polaromonas sp.]
MSRSAFVMWSVMAALGLAGAVAPLAARELPVGFLSLADDERYAIQALEKGYPAAPAGRAIVAAKLALDDAAFGLQAAGFDTSRVIPLEAADLAGIPGAIDALARQGVRHIVLELPAAGVVSATTAARGKNLILFNAAAPEDALRAAQCAPHLLHTLPSQAMLSDALAQWLVSRKWTRPLVLHGPGPQDALLLAAFNRSAKRFGLKPVAQRVFTLSNDPRERDLGNVRLLTANADYEVVVVLDAAGEFARALPYRTLLARPVVGSNGLSPQAWSNWYERHGAPQLNRRFFRLANRAMGSYDWAAWLATRAIADLVSQDAKAGFAQQLKSLKQGELTFDGYKGQAVSFCAWDGQLRQPLLLVHGNGIAELAPVEGFLHPKSVLDTLGFDAAETGCKAP